MNQSIEKLFTCKTCHRTGFTEAGLARHACKSSPRPSASTAPKSELAVVTDTLSTGPAGAGDDAIAGQQLTEQYHRAVAGMFEIFKCGAMMLRLREHLCDSTRGVAQGNEARKDTGLKAWMKSYAPTVPEGTAYRWMALAEALQEELSLGKKADLHLLLTAPDEELGDKLRKKKSAFFTLIEGKSQRQLLLEFGNESSGRGKHKRERVPPETPEQTLYRITNDAGIFATGVYEAEFFQAEHWKLLSDKVIDGLQFFMAEKAKEMRKHLQTTPSQRKNSELLKITN